MPKSAGAAAKTPRHNRQITSPPKGKRPSALKMAVTSHVGKASPHLKAEFQKLWEATMKKSTMKKVIREGNTIITIYH